jgi:hypothetical protein
VVLGSSRLDIVVGIETAEQDLTARCVGELAGGGSPVMEQLL